ncbi:MAG: tRNA (N6-threonylcarbamoyladenosine(37)-N6)-methyltransferase TrmO [Nitrososphaerota archaeon]|nr:tRNA (N6-threonylcarbamoyladenosine(37)-N6)-methyltransferase TrmO [Nitrososphaerales archaeon]MDW8045263.1 tRNA (N6-threonylcarbamoyladenosine(37)-N6)-methyltransferase TrmO [Nitrososphaerota archaeon]
MNYVLRPIGVVEKVEGEVAKVRIFNDFIEGLDQIMEFSHIIVIGWLHLSDREERRKTLKVKPKRHPGAPLVGVFASRSPDRPNPIGLCVTQLLGLEDSTLIVKGLDFIEGTPIIDIKPYLPRADCIPEAKAPEWTLHGPPT